MVLLSMLTPTQDAVLQLHGRGCPVYTGLTVHPLLNRPSLSTISGTNVIKRALENQKMQVSTTQSLRSKQTHSETQQPCYRGNEGKRAAKFEGEQSQHAPLLSAPMGQYTPNCREEVEGSGAWDRSPTLKKRRPPHCGEEGARRDQTSAVGDPGPAAAHPVFKWQLKVLKLIPNPLMANGYQSRAASDAPNSPQNTQARPRPFSLTSPDPGLVLRHATPGLIRLIRSRP